MGNRFAPPPTKFGPSVRHAAQAKTDGKLPPATMRSPPTSAVLHAAQPKVTSSRAILPPGPPPAAFVPAVAQAKPRMVPKAKAPTPFGGGVVQTVTKQIKKNKPSGLSNKSGNQSGHIYGIWKNPKCPGAIDWDNDMKRKYVLYIGKASLGENIEDRFIQHTKTDTTKPWHINNARDKNGNICGYGNDFMKWPYIVANIYMYKGFTKFDVAVAEQYYMQDAKSVHKAKLLNTNNAITDTKFDSVLRINPGVFTTKIEYGAWRPVDINSI